MNNFSLPVRVYYEDTDAGGIVYYVNYLKFMERARTEWLRTLGFNQTNLPVLFVVRDVKLSYQQPALLDDQLEVSLNLESYRGARLFFQQQITRNAATLCSGSIEVACVDRESLRPCRLPETLLHQLPQLDN
ncbi:tol-pal system-associated acyl-CoA thioesterase [Marinospirillum insulare]|uniref:Tol-pal system-associated acyl-CoA thioesterase n=1 Tax=Marinospirillum insulare TaxID=217169 RepID=A0ABQ5ZY25_9GAMM|nr:tol-pal system-associated acyl-CoA thioesterase [Marinospirillum insulare]GLR62840.1 tol-pal system-associated acyl-CoA thioesterase [Marinospirillum insulare]